MNTFFKFRQKEYLMNKIGAVSTQEHVIHPKWMIKSNNRSTENSVLP